MPSTLRPGAGGDGDKVAAEVFREHLIVVVNIVQMDQSHSGGKYLAGAGADAPVGAVPQVVLSLFDLVETVYIATILGGEETVADHLQAERIAEAIGPDVVDRGGLAVILKKRIVVGRIEIEIGANDRTQRGVQVLRLGFLIAISHCSIDMPVADLTRADLMRRSRTLGTEDIEEFQPVAAFKSEGARGGRVARHTVAVDLGFIEIGKAYENVAVLGLQADPG